MNKPYEFIRKTDYKNEVLFEIKELWDKYDDLLIVPNDKCFKGYIKGITFIDKITESSFNLTNCNSEKQSDRRLNKKLFSDNYSEYTKEFLTKMPEDRERRTSQVIAIDNRKFEMGTFSVCGWETVISQNDVYIEGKNGNPEIDMVIVKPSNVPSENRIIFVEYKCCGDSMLKGNQDLGNHYRDYKALIESDAINHIKKELLKSYELMYQIKHINNGAKISLNPDDFKKVEIGFLFVDKVDIDGRKAEITKQQYDEAKKKFTYVFDDKELLFSRAETVDKVNLNKWDKITDFYGIAVFYYLYYLGTSKEVPFLRDLNLSFS